MIGVHSKERKFKESVLANKNGFALIYGRRGLESSALLQSFAGGENSIYYHAAQSSDEAQQKLMGEAIYEKYSLLSVPEDYDDIFSKIEIKETESILICIDKAERILKKDGRFM